MHGSRFLDLLLEKKTNWNCQKPFHFNEASLLTLSLLLSSVSILRRNRSINQLGRPHEENLNIAALLERLEAKLHRSIDKCHTDTHHAEESVNTIRAHLQTLRHDAQVGRRELEKAARAVDVFRAERIAANKAYAEADALHTQEGQTADRVRNALAGRPCEHHADATHHASEHGNHAAEAIERVLHTLEQSIGHKVDEARHRVDVARRDLASSETSKATARRTLRVVLDEEAKVVGEQSEAEKHLHELRAECDHQTSAAQKELEMVGYLKEKLKELKHVSVADLEKDAAEVNKGSNVELKKITEMMLEMKVRR